MKTVFHKMTAVLFTGSILCSAMCLPVTAADDAAEETMTAVISLADNASIAEGGNVAIEGNIITISASGSYEISGELSDGQIVVNVADTVADSGTVKLFLNGVKLTGVSEAAILVENAENTSINLVEGTENYLYDGETYTSTTAVIYAKDDISIKGDGMLRIEAAYQQGLHCNNDVKINGGNLKVKTEVGDGIRGKQSVQIKSGNIDVNAGGDGIKSTKGDVLISGGSIEVKAGNDAIQGETSVQISGGSIKANGDRSLKNVAGAVSITGGTIFGTATDYQVESVESAQGIVMFQTTEEQVKDQMIALLNSDGNAIFEMNPDKKFDYVLISSPELSVGSDYTLTIGGRECSAFTLSETVTELDTVTVPEEAEVTNFDVNGDGFQNVLDAVVLARMVAEDETLETDPGMLSRSDVNRDGVTDIADTTMLLLFLAHKL